MRAIVQDRYGSPDITLRLAEVDRPEPKEDQVFVRVRASSVNAGDWRKVRATPFFVRFSEGLRRPKSALIGVDAAGVAEAVGKDVAGVRPGDEVYGARNGAFAEYVAGKSFVPKPKNLTLEQAAAVPVAGITALQAVRDHGAVKPGQHVLVTGAGGGVGSFTVQIAKAYGAEVTATTRTENVELVRSLGADHVVDYTREDVTRGGRRFDVILDVAGSKSFGRLRRALKPTGILVLVGAGHGPGGPIGGLVSGLIRSRLLRQRVKVWIAKVRTDDLAELARLIEAGKVTPVIDRTYPLEQVPEALRYLETERARGKVVITI